MGRSEFLEKVAHNFRNPHLTLLSGGNLLHLLEKHGHKVRIDLREAKKILGEKID